MAYADDNLLQGTPSHAVQEFTALVHLAVLHGFHVQPQKCMVYSKDAAAAASVAELLGVQHATNGFLAAGIPVGIPALRKPT
jgi:hypothetical protein